MVLSKKLNKMIVLRSRDCVIYANDKIAEHSEVIKKWLSTEMTNQDEQFVLDYSGNTANALLDYLNGTSVDIEQIQHICDFLMIKINNELIVENYCTEEIKKLEKQCATLEEQKENLKKQIIVMDKIEKCIVHYYKKYNICDLLGVFIFFFIVMNILVVSASIGIKLLIKLPLYIYNF